jgi:orotate phosphoribosyltransferase
VEANEILSYLAKREAVLTGKHFVYTSKDVQTSKNNHGPAYINMRQVAHDTGFLSRVGGEMAARLAPLQPDLVLGPETLGRTLANSTGVALGIPAIWCDIVEPNHGPKYATFSPKLNFQRLLPGKRVVIVDDLLTTGGSISLTAIAARKEKANIIGAACVVRRTPDVGAPQCSVPVLKVLAEVEGFEVLTSDECEQRGPCSRAEPIVRRPGHGWQWEAEHPDYSGGYTDLHPV